MKSVILATIPCFVLTGCLAGNMARDLALKGKPLSVVEQHYGQPTTTEAVQGGSRYTWEAPDPQHPCTLLVTSNAIQRVTNVKMVGGNQDCYRFGNMAAGKH